MREKGPEQRGFVAATLLTIGLAAGSLAVSNSPETHASPPVGIEQCKDAANGHAFLETHPNWEKSSAGVLKIKYLTSPYEYQTHNVFNFPELFAEKGIKVVNKIPPRPYYYHDDPSEQVEATYRALAKTPDKIVEAAGLRELVVADDVKTYKIEGNHLVLGKDGMSYYFQEGLADMLLTRYCGQAGTADLLRDYERITRNAGDSYNPNVFPDEGMSKLAVKRRGDWYITHGGNFLYPDSSRSPRQDLVTNIAQALGGLRFGRDATEGTAVGDKYSLAVGLLAEVEPHYIDFLNAMGFFAYAGTHDLHPHNMVDRVKYFANVITPKLRKFHTIGEAEYLVELDGPYMVSNDLGVPNLLSDLLSYRF